MKKREWVLLCILLCLALAGCGKGNSGGSREHYSDMPEPRYVSGYYGEKLNRSRNICFPYEIGYPESYKGSYTYPFYFDDPIYECRGFTVSYEITEVVKGDIFTGNFRYEVLVHTLDGKWKSGGVFKMGAGDDTATFVVELDKPTDIDAVAVTCGKQGDGVVYAFYMAVKDQVYT